MTIYIVAYIDNNEIARTELVGAKHDGTARSTIYRTRGIKYIQTKAWNTKIKTKTDGILSNPLEIMYEVPKDVLTKVDKWIVKQL